jgi:hypothetical protein
MPDDRNLLSLDASLAIPMRVLRFEDSGLLLTPKFGKESDLWVQLGKESVSWRGRISQMYSAKKSAVGYLLPFGKGTVELILRDWTLTWLKQGG